MIHNSMVIDDKPSYKYKLLFIVTIFYLATYTSSLLTTVYNYAILGYIRYFLLGIMMITFCYRFLISNTSKQEWLIILGFFLFVVFNFLFHYGPEVVPIVVFCAYSGFLKKREIIKCYTLGLTLTVLFVVLLSLIGLLPKIMQFSGFLTYGFGNPNSLGGILAIISMSCLYLYWKHINIWLLILYIIFIIINFSLLGDKSASFCMITYLFFYLIRHYIITPGFNSTLGLLGIIVPIILTILSVILTVLYGKYTWIYSVDDLLTKRIYTWNYYMNVDGIHLFPHNMSIIKANDYELGFYGGNIDPLLRGFFDGGYMFLLIRMGLINTIISLYIIGRFFSKLKLEKDVALQILLLIFIFYTFTENEWIAPYGFCVSYLITICFSNTIKHK